ncbi:MAG: 50S ribosomal protein L15 [Patescibacteria group bacterium]|jgi:large subunit ribosomal protein L15
MRIDELKPFDKKKSSKRVGRGIGSGKGKTSTRGMSGQKSRSGFNLSWNFEGGQSTLGSRLPKRRGIGSCLRKYQSLNIKLVESKFTEKEEINPEALVLKGLIKNTKLPVKIFGQTDKVYIIKNCRVTKSLLQLVKAEDAKKA